MDMASLLTMLADPRAYPFAVPEIEVRQTHISAIFLAGEVVYKIRKPVKLSFLDFSTLAQRRHDCNEEVRLNRRLAPDVYLGVVPITKRGSHLALEGEGEVIEWAVKMRRLPEAATLEQRLLRHDISRDQICALAQRLAEFHAAAAANEHIASFGKFETVARNIRENFAVATPLIGTTISQPVFDRLKHLTDQALDALRPLIDERAGQGVPRDTHGDLHLDHVYLFPEQPPPADLVIIDCIEFNERFRYIDPVADMAFLVMDLAFHGRQDLAEAFAEAYFQARNDDAGRRLLPLYVAYRAAVRGKVDGLQLAEVEIREADRVRARQRGRGHWMQALQTLEEPHRRPCLLLVGGVPGSGKSTLAGLLAERGGFRVLRSDLVRKELAGIPHASTAATTLPAEYYTAAAKDRVYAECLSRAEQGLFDGERIIVDATFTEERHRRDFLEGARQWQVPALFLVCETSPAAIQERLAQRQGDASDADWNIAQQLAQHWDPPGPETEPVTRRLCGAGPPETLLSQAVQSLCDARLLEPCALIQTNSPTP